MHHVEFIETRSIRHGHSIASRTYSARLDLCNLIDLLMRKLRFDYLRIESKLVQQCRGADSETVRDHAVVREA